MQSKSARCSRPFADCDAISHAISQFASTWPAGRIGALPRRSWRGSRRDGCAAPPEQLMLHRPETVEIGSCGCQVVTPAAIPRRSPTDAGFSGQNPLIRISDEAGGRFSRAIGAGPNATRCRYRGPPAPGGCYRCVMVLAQSAAGDREYPLECRPGPGEVALRPQKARAARRRETVLLASALTIIHPGSGPSVLACHCTPVPGGRFSSMWMLLAQPATGGFQRRS